VKVHFTRAKGKDNYKVNMMPIGAELKNMKRKNKEALSNGIRKQNKNMIQRVKWNDNGRRDEGRRKLM